MRQNEGRYNSVTHTEQKFHKNIRNQKKTSYSILFLLGQKSTDVINTKDNTFT